MGETNLTSSPTLIEGRPTWSNDGKWIYYSRRGLPPATDDDIVRERSDNSSTVPQIIVGSGVAEYQPELAPRNDAMCFTRGPFGSANADVYTIKPVDLLAGTQTDLSDSSAGAYNCAYSPEGDKVAFVEGVFTNGALKMKNSNDTGASTLVTTDTPMHFDGNPDWAPKRPAFCKGKAASIAGTDDAEQLKGTSERNVIQSHKGQDTSPRSAATTSPVPAQAGTRSAATRARTHSSAVAAMTSSTAAPAGTRAAGAPAGTRRSTASDEGKLQRRT